MNKRDFIKTSLIGAAALVSLPSIAKSSGKNSKAVAGMPNLTLPDNSLSGFLSNQNFQEHYKLFFDVANNLNSRLKFDIFKVDSIKDVLLTSKNYDSSTLEQANFYLNHKIFFKTLTPVGNFGSQSRLLTGISDSFGSFLNLKNEFETKASSSNSEGWIWLIYKNGKLFVKKADGEINPFSSLAPSDLRGYPVLGLDLHKHAFAGDYSNVENYVKSFWNYIDWNFVGKRYNRALLSKF
jgi:Fe-Mn family superoxide dismutase